MYAYLWNRSGTYYLILGKGKKCKRKSLGKDKELAEKVLERVRSAIADKKNGAADPLKFIGNGIISTNSTAGSITFRGMSAEYIQSYARKNKRSFKRDEFLALQVNGYLGDYTLSKITSLMIEDFKNKRVEIVSPSTVNRELAFIKQVFNKAIAWSKASTSPMKDVKFFKEPPGRTRFLEKDEIHKLIECCPPTLKPIVIAAVCTGMRKEEIASLKWSQVDLENGVITLFRTKSGEIKHVRINRWLYDTLTELKNTAGSEYVFISSRGERYTRISNVFANAVRRAGIKDFRFHDLRHTFASHLAMSGAGPMQIMEALGVKSIRMVQRYTHLSRSHTFSAVDKLADRLNP